MDIVFVILHYMTPEYTKKCVESIQCRLDTKKYKIIIVDNASPDKSGQMLATLYKSSEDVDVVLLEENCGFAKGNNIGIKLSCEKYNPKFVMWILVYVIYEVLDAWFISNKRTYAVRLFKIMFGIAIGIFILSIVKIKGNTILSLVTGKFTGLFSEDSRSYMQRYGALIIALELILQKNSIFGFLFGNGLSSLVGNFVTNRRTITDLNFYVIDNQYITSWYDSGFVFLILCVFICVHFIIELTKIIVDKHIEISLRKKSLVLLIGSSSIFCRF